MSFHFSPAQQQTWAFPTREVGQTSRRGKSWKPKCYNEKPKADVPTNTRLTSNRKHQSCNWFYMFLLFLLWKTIRFRAWPTRIKPGRVNDGFSPRCWLWSRRSWELWRPSWSWVGRSARKASFFVVFCVLFGQVPSRSSAILWFLFLWTLRLGRRGGRTDGENCLDLSGKDANPRLTIEHTIDVMNLEKQHATCVLG